jgi:hypothetical protein
LGEIGLKAKEPAPDFPSSHRGVASPAPGLPGGRGIAAITIAVAFFPVFWRSRALWIGIRSFRSPPAPAGLLPARCAAVSGRRSLRGWVGNEAAKTDLEEKTRGGDKMKSARRRETMSPATSCA